MNSKEKQVNNFIRSSKVSIKFTNTEKLNNVNLFINEYKKTTQQFIDILWPMEKIPSLIPKEITTQIQDNTWLSARALQCSAKQASGIVRGTKQKQKKRIFQHEKLLKEGKPKQARKLQKVIDDAKISKPEIKKISPELDSRFIKIDLDNNTSFDGWVTVSNLGNKMKIQLPFKRTKHFNELMKNNAELKKGIRLGENFITFAFEFIKNTRKNGKTLGLDIGIKNVFTTSDNQVSQASQVSQVSQDDEHGWNLEKIQEKISRRQKGSKGFRKACAHRKNHINRVLNNLNLVSVNKLRIEKIKNLRRNKRTSRYMSHWTYTDIFDKLKLTCETLGVQVEEVDPTFTSQRCSECGWTRKRNRKGKKFVCNACGFTCDADYNASLNISLKLPKITRKQRQHRANLRGFYWLACAGQDYIVPDVQAA